MSFIQPEWPAPKRIKAYTTIRSSWGERNSINLPNQQANERLTALLDLPAEPLWLTQTHSALAVEAEPQNQGQKADASYTSNPNQICTVVTADCLPLLICNKKGTFVAAIHAGWRGLAGGIIEATLKHAPEPAHDLLVWLGPAIGPQKFEVGRDVFEAFAQHTPHAASAFVPSAEEKWLADLYELARIRLTALGVSAIYGGNFCTHTQSDLFYSYRRDQGQTGRMASLIWIIA